MCVYVCVHMHECEWVHKWCVNLCVFMYVFMFVSAGLFIYGPCEGQRTSSALSPCLLPLLWQGFPLFTQLAVYPRLADLQLLATLLSLYLILLWEHWNYRHMLLCMTFCEFLGIQIRDLMLASQGLYLLSFLHRQKLVLTLA